MRFIKIHFLFWAILSFYFSSNRVLAQGTNEVSFVSCFVENKGQVADADGKLHPEVLFKSDYNDASLFFKDNGIVYMFTKFDSVSTDESKKERAAGNYNRAKVLETKPMMFRMDLIFENTNPLMEIVSSGKRSEVSNYYQANCPNGVLDVHHYDTITYKNIYQNIDITYYFTIKGLKYDIIIHPGGNISDISYRYDGANNVTLNDEGDLFINYADGQIMTEEKPIVYFANNLENKIKINYHVDSENGLISYIGENNTLLETIVIDPAVTWATYFHNTNSANSNWTNTEYDASGNFFMADQTYDNAFPLANPGGGAWYDASKTTMIKIAVLKFNSSRTLVWSTYYGGNQMDCLAGCTDYGKALALDNSGNVYIAGYTDGGTTVFPTYNPGGAFYQDQSKCYGETSFFLKFNSGGVRQWASMIQHEQANTNGTMMRVNGITCDGTYLYFTGQQYNWYPANTIPLRNPGGGAHYQTTILGDQDVFVGRFVASTCVLNWCTYLHSTTLTNTAYGQGLDLHCDAGGNLFVTGRESGANSHHYLINSGGGAYYQSTKGANGDLFITKFNTSLTAVWGTYYGGNGMDIPSTVEPDAAGNIYIVGRVSQSTDFPTLNPGGGALYQAAKSNAASDGFLIKFTASNCVRTWATYLGATVPLAGSDENHFYGLAFNTSNNHVFVMGDTPSNTIPTINKAGSYNQSIKGGGYDMFFYEFDNGGVPQWASYYGGTGNEQFYNGRIGFQNTACGLSMVTHVTTSTQTLTGVNPGGGAWYQGTTTFANNDFILELSDMSSPLPVSVSIAASANPICSGASVTFTASPVNGGSSPSYQWYLNGSPVGTNSSTYSNSALSAGNTIYCVLTSSSVCVTGNPATSNTVTISVISTNGGSLSSSATNVCEGTPVTISNSTWNAGYNGGYIGYWASTEGGYPCNWDIYAGAYTGQNSFSYTYPANPNTSACESDPYRIYIYSAVYNNTCGWDWSAGRAVAIWVYPNLSATLSGGSTNICNGATPSSFTATGSGSNVSYTYLWYKGGVSTGVTTQTYSTGALTASTTVYCAVTSSPCGTVNTATYYINVVPAVSISNTVTNENCPTDNNGTINISLSGGLSNIQYIKLTQKYADYTNLAELEAIESFTGTNVALNAAATSSSVYAAGYEASKFVDGNTSNMWHSATGNIGEWITIDLGAAKNLDYIRIYNRSDCCWQRSQNLLMEFYNASNVLIYQKNINVYEGINGAHSIVENVQDISWSDGGSTLNHTGLNAGTYTLNYSDASGCSTTTNVSNVTTNNTESVAPTSITGTNVICNGSSTTLTVNGGSLGTGASWKWYTGSCGGTFVNTGNSITVSPSSTTTFYVRAEGTCNTTICASLEVTVNSLSIAPTSIAGTTTICNGTSTTLTAIGGIDGTGANLNWYTGACGDIYSQEWFSQPYGYGSTTVNSVNGVLNVTSTTNDPMIFMSGLGSFDPNIYKYIHMRYRVTAGTAGSAEIFFYNTSHNYAVGGESATGSLITDGAWHILNIDMSMDLQYTTGGNITGWRFDWSSASGVTMDIDYISLGAGLAVGQGSSISVSPNTSTTYYVLRSGACNTTSCASQLVTVTSPSSSSPTSLSNGDYIWSGNTSLYWGIATNWLIYNGSTFSVAGTIPTSTNNVFIRAYAGCASNAAHVASGSSANCNNLTIETGLTMDNTSSVLNVYGNWTNNGTFTANNNTVFFNGNTSQMIGGTSTTTFNNLTINNSGGTANGVFLGLDIPVNGVVNLTVGALKLNTHKLIVNDGTPTAIVRNGTTSFGYIVSELNNADNTSILQWNFGSNISEHIFPFGTFAGEYIPVKIQGSGTGPGNISISTRPTGTDNTPLAAASNVAICSQITGGGGSNNGVTSVIDRWWDISSSLNPTGTTPIPPVTLTLTYRGSENTMTSPTSILGFQHWTGSTWNDGHGGAAGTVTSTGTAGSQSGQNSVTASGLTQFSPYIIVRANAPLPVELLNFTATCNDDKVIIKWSTASEINNDYFTIERSQDGLVWETLFIVQGAGNSNNPLSYEQIDNSPISGTTYYRLKQTDYDGSYKYFDLAEVNCNVEGSLSPLISLYPNPFNSDIIIDIQNFSDNSANIVIYDIIGNKVLEKSITKSQIPEHELTLELNALSFGVYTLIFVSDNFSTSSRIIKINSK